MLVDSEPLSNRALAETLTELGIPTTPEEAVRAFKGRTWAYVEETVRRRAGHVPPELRPRYRRRMFDAFAADLRPIPGVADALAEIDLPMCVASNGLPDKMRFTLGHVGLLERFEGRIFSAVEVAEGKPAPDLFLHAARSLGWAPEGCVVVEDSKTGVTAGRAAGMTVLGYAGAANGAEAELRAAGATQVFRDMAELPELLSAAAAPRSRTARARPR